MSRGRAAGLSNTNELHRSRIDWDTIKEADFNRLVEALLVTVYRNIPGEVAAINGRGGDGGIDVAIWENGVVTKIFQLKYYPQGFTGGFAKTRRPEIKNSFETAWKNHAPAEWILVMPPNPHVNEKKFVDALPAGRDVKVSIWGQAKLDAALADHPKVERAALRNELVDVLTQMGMEKAALVGQNDLSERVAAIGETGNSRSDYWDTNFSFEDGEVEETYVAKHPEAMKMEPIQTKITFHFTLEDQALADRVRDSFDYGSFEPVALPPTATLTREGPKWVKPFRNSPNRQFELVHDPGMPEKPELLTLNFVDPAGFSQGRFEGKVVGRVYGAKGLQIKSIFSNIMTLVMRVNNDPADRSGGMSLNFKPVGASPTDVMRAMEMFNAFQPDRVLELYHEGKRATKMQIGPDSVDWPSDAYTEELVEDLFILERKLPSASFVVPEETKRRDRVMIRVARLLLEGYRTFMPPGTDLTAVLSGGASDELHRFVNEGGNFSAGHKPSQLSCRASSTT